MAGCAGGDECELASTGHSPPSPCVGMCQLCSLSGTIRLFGPLSKNTSSAGVCSAWGKSWNKSETSLVKGYWTLKESDSSPSHWVPLGEGFQNSGSLDIKFTSSMTSHMISESESESHSVVSNSLQTRGLYTPWNSPAQNTVVGSLSLSLGDLPNPGIKPRSPTLQVDSLPAEPQRKPKNTGVGSLSLLQQIFPTQELNWGLLPCGQIPSYQGSPTWFQR